MYIYPVGLCASATGGSFTADDHPEYADGNGTVEEKKEPPVATTSAEKA